MVLAGRSRSSRVDPRFGVFFFWTTSFPGNFATGTADPAAATADLLALKLAKRSTGFGI